MTFDFADEPADVPAFDAQNLPPVPEEYTFVDLPPESIAPEPETTFAEVQPTTVPIEPEAEPSAEPNTETDEVPPSKPPVKRWTEINDFVRICIKMGLSGPQISALSLSTPQPMKSHQAVYDRIQSANLVRLFESKKIRRRRIGPHNKGIMEIFSKVYGQALEHGHEVRDVMRDESPHPRARFRVDVGLRIGPRLFFWEEQISKMDHVRWWERLRNFVRLYEQLNEPFRVIFRLNDEFTITKVAHYAREVLQKDHPNLNLFYFVTAANFNAAWNVITEPIYHGAWNPSKKFALMA